MRVVTRNQRGDTIVEVLVALTVIGMVLAGAYTTASRSLALTRISQERAEATKVAEGQVEAVKAAIATAGAIPPAVATGAQFCIDESSLDIKTGTSPTLPALASAVLAGVSTGGIYPDDCISRALYYPHIVFDAATNRFTATVRWERFSGGFDEIQIIYGVVVP
jgi:prepilin-type N-terminal cleavage/methylation domain-containing protein